MAHIDYLLGGVEGSLGRFEDAEQRPRKEIGRDPHSLEANYVLGALVNKEAKCTVASPFLEQALKESPKHSQALYELALHKEAGGGFTPWHADQYYWPLSTDKTATAWIPLQRTLLEMGPLAFSRKSFLIQEGRNLAISEESEQRIRTTMKGYGEVSFHSGQTFHRAGPNNADKPREVITIIYMDQDIRLIELKNENQEDEWERWCPSAKVGNVVDSHLNPVIYSLRTDDSGNSGR